MSNSGANGQQTDDSRPPLSSADSRKGEGRGAELRAFVGLSVFLAPALTVALVGALGFGIWIAQMIFGPPGPQG